MMQLKLCLALLLCSVVVSLGNAKYHPEIDLHTPDIIRLHGYPSETHTIETSDGYLLDIHRIPHSPNRTKSTGVILLQHGIVSSSICWVDNRIAFYISNQGYDVWLGNVRGNTYGKKHATLSPDDTKFWDFSFNDMAMYDIPAMIDHILNTTGEKSLTYIGHSMGTTMFFAMASSTRAYDDKINLMVGLAPVAYVQHMRSPLRTLAPFANDFAKIDELLGHGLFPPESKYIQQLSEIFCDYVSLPREVCTNALFLITGYDIQEFDEDLLPVILAHCTDTTSVKVVNHFAQLIKSGKFRNYDYGAEENVRKYNSSSPPPFNLTSISIPVALIAGDNDLLVEEEDLLHLKSELPNVAELYKVPYHNFNHLDFIYAKDVIKLVFIEVIRLIKSCTERECTFQRTQPKVILARNLK